MGTGFPDLVELLVNAGKVAPALLMMLQGIVAVMGLYLVGWYRFQRTAKAQAFLWCGA